MKYIQVLAFDNANQQITFICILKHISPSPIAFRMKRLHNLEIPEIVHMRPSLCYVSTFLDFISPTHPMSASIALNVNKNHHFSDLNHPSSFFDVI